MKCVWLRAAEVLAIFISASRLLAPMTLVGWPPCRSRISAKRQRRMAIGGLRQRDRAEHTLLPTAVEGLVFEQRHVLVWRRQRGTPIRAGAWRTPARRRRHPVTSSRNTCSETSGPVAAQFEFNAVQVELATTGIGSRARRAELSWLATQAVEPTAAAINHAPVRRRWFQVRRDLLAPNGSSSETSQLCVCARRSAVHRPRHDAHRPAARLPQSSDLPRQPRSAIEHET